MLRPLCLLLAGALPACGVETSMDGPVPLMVMETGGAGCPASVSDLPPSRLAHPADRRLQSDGLVIAFKEKRRLGVYEAGRLAERDGRPQCFTIALGLTGPRGHKRREGDRRTPEGWYRTSDKPWSTFENAVAIHYPNRRDARMAERDGRIGQATRERIVAALDAGKKPPQGTPLGGQILIHGGGSWADWTAGCIALDDADLLRVRAAMPDDLRTNILILP